ncbi:MAG: S41 family peptidase [Candidatus Omnitrophota bacterium]|nr:S41 family peptidase [Candidatus Omnitrophota bacterium]MDZ4243142.1 S41 family peptidase [Candidatus Omnitrophota bacterium]
MGKKVFSLILTGFIFLTVTTLALSQIDNKAMDDLYSQVELFSYALTTIQSEYVDEKKPKELIYGSLKGMLSSLDPHSQFLDPDEYEELKTETQGKFGGLGIEISIRDGLLTVISPIEDTPAWKAGIKAGDRIVKIEDDLTRDLTLSEAVKKLRGDPGTKIKITVLREDEFKLLDFTIIREVIQVQDIKDPQILEDNIGYLRLTEFREESFNEFRKAIVGLKDKGADSLIVDMRNNPGGLLNIAIKISEEFLPVGQTIVSTKGRRSSQDTVTLSKESPDKILDWPMVVLINEGSASGSEIFAGALKDNKRAVIVGEKSFGKGSVQSVIPLPDGSGLRLTTSKYFTPSGVCIHGIGIMPDVVVKREERDKKEDEEEKKAKKDVSKIFDDVQVRDAEDPERIKLTQKEREARDRLLNDNQVQTAMSVLKGIKVYKKLNGG